MKKLRPAAVIGKTGKWTLLMLLAVFEVFPLIQLLFNSFRPDVAARNPKQKWREIQNTKKSINIQKKPGKF